jgi:hypothetical protein
MKRLTFTDSYPFLFSIYPVIALSSINLGYINFNSIFRSLVFTLIITSVLIIFLSLITRSKEKGKLLSTGIILIFFSYGQVYDFLKSKISIPVHHRYLFLFFILLLVLITLFILRTRTVSKSLENFLTTTSIILVVISIIPTIKYSVTNAISQSKDKKTVVFNSEIQNLPRPDIYLIILDSYTRADVLKEDFQFDNSSFLNQLKDLGFYVADCSQSNYPSTKYSLSSLMQVNYLQDINPNASLAPFSRTVVTKSLRSLGYSVYSFENWSKGHFDLGEDKQFSRNNPKFGLNLTGSGLNEFESMLLKTTVIRIIFDMPQLVPGFDPLHLEYYEHFEQVKYTLTELPNMPLLAGPKFVFVHIMVPHEPYIFTPEGEYKYNGNVYKGYPANISFINNNLPSILKKIIDNSKIPPVIIIQGDHGPNLNPTPPATRHSILNAYFVNAAAKNLLYPSISPVNSFRVVFDSYFNENMELIPDKSYYAYTPNKMTEENLVPNQCTK